MIMYVSNKLEEILKAFQGKSETKIKLSNWSHSSKSRKYFYLIWQQQFLMELIAYENHWWNVQNGPDKLGLWLPGLSALVEKYFCTTENTIHS